MSKTVKISMEVKNLDCANCALKIENEISQLDGVQLVSLNLMSDTLKIILDEKKKTEILKQSQLIADRVEPGTKFISREETDHQESKVDIELIKLLVSTSLFIFGIFTNGNLQLSFFVASYLISGYKVLLTALKNLKRGVIFDENFLMSIATIGAFSIGEPLEAAAVMVFYNVGEYLQHKAVTRSKKNILDLLDNRNMVIHRLENGVLQDIDLNDVQVDDVLEIRVGEKIPVDGYIIQSETSLDTKAITGESLPVYVQTDSYVVSGSINLDRVVLMKASTTYQNSTTAQIVEAMKEASDKRADTEKMIGKFARIYTPIVVLIATIIALVFPLLFKAVSPSEWIYRSLVFLVASCPCALVVSVPLTYFSGLGKASRSGILIKSAQVFDEVVKLRAIYFDKTGTVTKGNFKVVFVDGHKEEALRIASALEQSSNHPLAIAIKEQYTSDLVVTNLKEVFGQGLIGFIDNKLYLVGNDKLMTTNKIDIPKSQQDYTTIYVASESQWIGTIYLADEVKESSIAAIQQLRNQGYKTVLLTGDNQKSVNIINEHISFDEVHAGLLPNDKSEQLIENSLFVGDGINDALVLVSANVGVAMGGLGSDIAIEAADVVIMNDSLMKINELIGLSKRVHAIVTQNIVLALLIKIGVLVLGAFGYVDMLVGVFADVGVTLLAVLNALRLMRK